jgi:glycosyltransferase involved in cell wall biosynthesis
MQLDVVIPTYNRRDLLQRTLQSLLAAPVPSGLYVQVFVVDNNSKDDTRAVVESWQEKFAGNLQYRFEKQQGRSYALNAGIAAGKGDLVGMIDDDEEIDQHWYQVIHDAFRKGNTDFIGGPYQPRWGMKQIPEWLPSKYVGVIGWIDGGNKVRPYDESYPGILMGGNAIFTRQIVNQVGLYNTSLGRTAKGLLTGEDEEMYKRLLKAGARGYYLPELVIYHYVPPERLTKRYFRRWCFWRGVSIGQFSRQNPVVGQQVIGVPRWLYGEAVRGIREKARQWLAGNRNPAQGFAGELAVWDLMGFFYGRHFFKSGT